MPIEILDIEAESYYQRWSTGFKMIDAMIGGGFSRGIVELSGMESTGKSMLLYQIMGFILRHGGAAALYDQEDAFLPDRAERLMRIKLADYIVRNEKGQLTSTSKFIPSRAEDLEELLADMADQAKIWRDLNVALAGQPLVFGMDSLAGTESAAEAARGYHEKEYASVPASLSRNLKKTISASHRYTFTLFLINQLRDKIGVTWGKKKDTPGGNALKFYCMLRLELQRIKTLPDGALIRIRSVKNKLFVPQRTLIMPFKYESGFDDFEIARETLIQLGYAKRTGTAMQIKDKDGDDDWVEFPKLKKDYDRDSRTFIMKRALAVYRAHDYLVEKPKEHDDE